MSSKRFLAGIPIILEVAEGPRKLHWRRRVIQVATLLLAILIPLCGLFRIDPIAGAFVVLDRQIWWSDFAIVFGFWLLMASGLVMLYSSVGTAFCGWSCPQNTLAEWANWLTRRWLGKRASIELDGRKMSIGSRKDRILNWGLLSASLLGMALVAALIPLLYFYPADVIWSFVIFREDARLASSIHYIYFVFVVVLLLDIAFIRHFWCRFMCVYKVWQHGFKTGNTLKIHYDSTRAHECEKCNYCVTACFIDIDPRQTNTYDSCINCGECITACNLLQAKKGAPGLLSFRMGEAKTAGIRHVFGQLSKLSTRVRWTLPFSLLGLVMFSWGLAVYSPYHLAVYQAETRQGVDFKDYRIAISNKKYHPGLVSLSVQGLQADQYTLSRPKVLFDTAGRVDLYMVVEGDLEPGLHSFIVQAKSMDGWQANFRVQHFVPKG